MIFLTGGYNITASESDLVREELFLLNNVYVQIIFLQQQKGELYIIRPNYLPFERYDIR